LFGPDLALAFFRKAAEGLRVELRQGLPWLSARARGRPSEGRPYFGAASYPALVRCPSCHRFSS
jgi:hypothetical protein